MLEQYKGPKIIIVSISHANYVLHLTCIFLTIIESIFQIKTLKRREVKYFSKVTQLLSSTTSILIQVNS